MLIVWQQKQHVSFDAADGRMIEDDSALADADAGTELPPLFFGGITQLTPRSSSVPLLSSYAKAG